MPWKQDKVQTVQTAWRNPALVSVSINTCGCRQNGGGGSEEVEKQKKTTNYREQVKSRYNDPQILKVPSHKVSIRAAGKEEHVPGDCTQRQRQACGNLTGSQGEGKGREKICVLQSMQLLRRGPCNPGATEGIILGKEHSISA